MSTENLNMIIKDTTNIFLGYGTVRGLVAEVGDSRVVSVSWIPPPFSPPMGYEVWVPTASIREITDDFMFTATFPNGLHTIQVRTFSQHYLGEWESTTVEVRGERRHRIISSEA